MVGVLLEIRYTGFESVPFSFSRSSEWDVLIKPLLRGTDLKSS